MVTVNVPSFSVSSDTQTDSNLWVSNTYNVDIKCRSPSGTDYPHVYFNPKNELLSNSLYMVASVNGQELSYSSPKIKISDAPTIGDGKWYNYNFSLIFSLRSRGSVPESGQYDGSNVFSLLQFDGQTGLNTSATNLQVNLSGLQGITFQKCGANVVLSPSSGIIDFGVISKSQVESDGVIMPFTVTADVGNCDQSLRIGVLFNALTSSYDAIELENGLDLSIYNDYGDKQFFGRENTFGSTKGNALTRGYEVYLQRSGRKKDISLGPFSTSMVVTFNYH